MNQKIILFLLVAIKLFNIRLVFPVMTGKMQPAKFYCDLFQIVCSSNSQKITVWELGKNKFV